MIYLKNQYAKLIYYDRISIISSSQKWSQSCENIIFNISTFNLTRIIINYFPYRTFYHPQVPAPPLKGPSIFDVIHPP